MSIEKLKSELVEAGLPASEGPHLSVEDHRLLKDLLYFQGRNLMQELHDIGFRSLNKVEGWLGIEQQNEQAPTLKPETPDQPKVAGTEEGGTEDGDANTETSETSTEEEPKTPTEEGTEEQITDLGTDVTPPEGSAAE